MGVMFTVGLKYGFSAALSVPMEALTVFLLIVGIIELFTWEMKKEKQLRTSE